jgi:hypothetical protein
MLALCRECVEKRGKLAKKGYREATGLLKEKR